MNSKDRIVFHQFDNGLVLVAESMPWLESAAFSISVPAGCIHEPEDKLGLAGFVCEMVQRGCGERDSHQFVEALEYLGVDYASSTSLYHTHFGCAMPAAQLLDALAIYADVLRRPWIAKDQVEDARQVCFQEVRAVEDDLAQKVMMKLRLLHYGPTMGRSSPGTLESIQRVTRQDIGDFQARHYHPGEMIISVAGRVEWPSIQRRVEQLFADWPALNNAAVDPRPGAGGCEHITFDSHQTHIGVAFPSLPYSHPDYFQARGLVGVLSDGMSSRLFTELREKRGLCYAVAASLHSLKNQACVATYVGTSADRAQQSLDLLIEQFRELARGIQPDELDRLKVQIRSSLIMQQESSRSRAASIAADWYHLGRIRTLDEVTALINALSAEGLNEFAAANPPSRFDVVSLGPQALELNRGVSANAAT